jgi:hypothetical protein
MYSDAYHVKIVMNANNLLLTSILFGVSAGIILSETNGKRRSIA